MNSYENYEPLNFLNTLEEIQDLNEINESMLDISIKAQDKVLKNKAQREEFLSSKQVIYHKTDGIKLTVLKIQNEGKLTDYIFQYKGSILYPEEYEYETDFTVKQKSVGTSQFQLVFKHFNSLGKNTIPVGTELFIEYLMNKPTLSSNYSTTHKMVLIGYSKSSWDVKFGKLKTSPSSFETVKRPVYQRELNIDTPQKLFSGILGYEKSFEQGILNNNLKKEFQVRKNSIVWDNPELLIQSISEMLLQVESKYGGKEEGVVIYYGNEIIKFQQEYQLDQNARRQIKAKFQDTPENENTYWNNVNRVQNEIQFHVGKRRGLLPQRLKEMSLMLKTYKLDFTHPKKTEVNIKDDIQLNCKTLIIKDLRGNNGQLVLGKFRVLTKDGHVKLINKALREFDQVTVCLVTSKETKETRELRLNMLKQVFGNNPKVNIIEHSSGNLIGIINKSPININQVIQGSDRVQAYQNQLTKMIGVSVQELQRDDGQISQSEVISKLDDENFFKKSTPPEVHKFYNELKDFYK